MSQKKKQKTNQFAITGIPQEVFVNVNFYAHIVVESKLRQVNVALL
jgi:hypothetical protein